VSIVGEPARSEPSTPKKDVWDKLAILLPFVSGLLIAVVGGVYTYLYNRQASDLATLQTAQSYIEPLTGSEETRQLARQVIGKLATPEMQLALAEITRDGTPAQREAASTALVASVASVAVVFDNSNISGVANGGVSPVVVFDRPHLIASIRTYHWNGARGATPGTHALKGESGSSFGPWPAVGYSGFQDAPNVDWYSTPNITVPAGRYTVIDSAPATWSQNAMSNGEGFVTIRATPAP
jgi:hypothetical protein